MWNWLWWELSFTSHQRFSQGSEVSVSYFIRASPKKKTISVLYNQCCWVPHCVAWRKKKKKKPVLVVSPSALVVGRRVSRLFWKWDFVRRHVRRRGGRLIHLLHHRAIMTCMLSCMTHFQLQYECFMSSSGTLVGTLTLTTVLSDLVQWANNWPRLSCSYVDAIVENVSLIVGISLKVKFNPGWANFSSSLKWYNLQTTVPLLYHLWCINHLLEMQ